MSSHDLGLHSADATPEEAEAYVQTEQMLWLLVNDLQPNVDQPEIWAAFPQFLAFLPDLRAVAQIACRNSQYAAPTVQAALHIIIALCDAHSGRMAMALDRLTELATILNGMLAVQGALFHVQGLANPTDPKYRLEGQFCTRPFDQLHVLESSTHQCCASWLPTSVGNLHNADWRDVWNSDTAQQVRASVHDGSFRHCNKIACPNIQNGSLPKAAEVAVRSPEWQRIVETAETALDRGPIDVNLAYDRTCNLSCPSCRVEKYAADEATRTRYTLLQERNILPMLRQAKSVFITGSGDPFASKNFRQLMTELTPDAYPDLRFRIMTNAMLFTPREWERFPALHNRVMSLQISIDGASADTHEVLRRGARWSVMEQNLEFAAGLLHAGLVDSITLSFTVQARNYHEMGLACDLAARLGLTGIYFGRLTNWGTFSPQGYANQAVFTPGHPNYQDFLSVMADPRLRARGVNVGNLSEFLPSNAAVAA